MKKLFITLSAVVAALFIAGCQNDINNEQLPVEATHTVTFTAEKILETKTAIASEADGVVSYKWIEGDEARMHITESYTNGETSVNNPGTVTAMSLSNGDKTATFYVTFSGAAPTGEVEYNAVYAGHVSGNGNLQIPANQSPLQDSFDPNADAMVADVITRTDGRDENISFKFNMNRKVSVNKMTLKGLVAGETVNQVVFESDKYHASYYKVSSGEYTSEGKKLTFTFTSNNIVPASGEFPVYFTTAPVTDATFSVTVVTDQKRYYKTSSKTISFAVGQVRRFSVNLAGCEQEEGREFTLVTDVDDLEIGADVVIAANGSKDKAMSIVQNPNNRGVTDATKNSDYSKIAITEQVQVFTLVDGTTSGTYAFSYVEDGTTYYLYAASSSSNYLRSQTTLDDNASWEIAISNKEATVTAQGSNTRNILRYNSSSDMFSCYASGQQTVFIYQAGGRPSPDMSWSADAAAASITSAGIVFNNQPTLNLGNASSVTYSSSDESVATIAADGTVTIVGEGSTSITASFAGSTAYAPANASYTLTVTDDREAVAAPTFSPVAGEVASGTTVTIATATSGATILYTTGSSAFSAGDWTEYTEPVVVTAACTIKAIATASNYKNSEVTSAAYTLEPNSITISEVISASNNTSVKTTGVVAQTNQKGFILTDGNANIFVYLNAIPSVAVGQAVTVKGTRGSYNNVAQITSPTITAGATGQTVTRTPLTIVTSSNATSFTTSVYVSLTGTLTISGTFYNISIAGSQTQGSLYQLSGNETFTAGNISELNGSAITVLGYVTGRTNNYLSIAPVDIELDDRPELSITPATSSESPAAWASGVGDAKTFTVMPTNGTWNYSATNMTWATISRDGNVLTVTPNTAQSSTANSGSITVTLTPNNSGYSPITKTIYLAQAKYISGSEQVTLQYTTNTTTNMTGDNDAATVGLDATKWSVVGAKNGNNNFPGLNKAGDIRLYWGSNDAINTITVSSLDNSTINSITITYTDSNYNNGKVLVGGNEVSISDGSYPINSTSFVITNGNTSNVQVRIKSIVINYTPAN